MTYKLPVKREEAERMWKEFSDYLVQERYSIRDPQTGKPLEKSYDEVIDRVAATFENREVQQAFRSKKLIIGTPGLMNLGNHHTHRSGYFSCYPLGAVEDSTEAILEAERKMVTIFQHAGGAGIDGSNLRPAGSMVDNGQGTASGPVGFLKGYSHLSEHWSQGGKRRGALMGQLDYTHPDVKEFVSFKGAEPGKYTGINVAVNVTDDGFWDDSALISNIAENMWKSGDPGLLFTQRAMADSPVPSEFEPRFSNPCTPGETRILTRDGYHPIGKLVADGWEGEIWNGKEWSTVKPFHTGRRHTRRISFSDGTSLRCTDNHKFILKDYSRKIAADLKLGDALGKFDMPVVETGETYVTDAYSQGFYSGDGSTGLTYSKLYEPKYSCSSRLIGEIRTPINLRNFVNWWHGPMLRKAFVPLNGTKEYCLNWLAGILDADGTVCRNPNSCSLQLTSIDRKFLVETRLMLTRLGVQAEVSDACNREGFRQLPDGKGGLKAYYCQKAYRLLINSFDTAHLLDTGLTFERLDIDQATPQRDARRFVIVTAISDERLEDVYCFTEQYRHQGTFEGIVTGQCGEFVNIAEVACNLPSINLQAILTDMQSDFLKNVKHMAELACLAGNEILDMPNAFPPIDEIKEATLRHRPVGVGLTGLHAALVHFNFVYGTQEAVEFTEQIYACMLIGTLACSQTYGQRHKLEVRPWRREYINRIARSYAEACLPEGLYSAGVKVLQKLVDSRGAYNAVTMSQAPTGSTSQLLHVASTGIEPYFDMVQERRVRTADGGWKTFTLVPLEFYDYSETKLGWIAKQTAHRITPEAQIAMVEAAQKFCNTGVSKTINLPASATKEDIVKLIHRARHSNIKGLTVFRDSSMEGILKSATLKVEAEPTIEKPLAPRKFKDIPKRKGLTFKFSGPSSLYITVNFGDREDLMEVFIFTTKPGSEMNAMCSALGRVISVALQYDTQITARLTRTLEGMSSEGVWTNGLIGRVFSIPAAVAGVIKYCTTLQTEEAAALEAEKTPQAVTSSFTDCPSCGNMSLRRDGGCSKCVGCGYSSC